MNYIRINLPPLSIILLSFSHQHLNRQLQLVYFVMNLCITFSIYVYNFFDVFLLMSICLTSYSVDEHSVLLAHPLIYKQASLSRVFFLKNLLYNMDIYIFFDFSHLNEYKLHKMCGRILIYAVIQIHPSILSK